MEDLKLCKDCKHYVGIADLNAPGTNILKAAGFKQVCAAQLSMLKPEINLVTGDAQLSGEFWRLDCNCQRGHEVGDILKRDSDVCGREGLFYDQRTADNGSNAVKDQEMSALSIAVDLKRRAEERQEYKETIA
jgi:hypothetical protein